MRVFTRWIVVLPVLIILALGICKKPIFEKHLADPPPLVLVTSIEDSLPSSAVKALKLKGVEGIKIQYHNGLYTSYFEYQADPDAVINTISQLSFPIHASFADTTCRPLGFALMELIRNQISLIERETTENFWTVDQKNFNVYECIKGSFRHTLQISKTSTRIFHRIEFMG